MMLKLNHSVDDHAILRAMFLGLSMCYMVEKDEYPYEETLAEKIEREGLDHVHGELVKKA